MTDLRAEEIRVALIEAEDDVTYQAEVLASEHPWPIIVAAARAYLASLEDTEPWGWCVTHQSAMSQAWRQMPVVNPTCDVEMASETATGCDMRLIRVPRIVDDAALAGFRSQPKGDNK